ncbi:sodium- and chloride-dependent glycine transporter 1-like [Gigantopelta aegis]|uniref:sodium- and chloride-dependent glycine transporter 1-like n=1 Tax=Gigantopelta aegis TaxID=1735272 RepID=UPI001B88D530|nr:sodium- and chloride-dependent glycine transporter 1-like [Gigantopelta aegis]
MNDKEEEYHQNGVPGDLSGRYVSNDKVNTNVPSQDTRKAHRRPRTGFQRNHQNGNQGGLPGGHAADDKINTDSLPPGTHVDIRPAPSRDSSSQPASVTGSQNVGKSVETITTTNSSKYFFDEDENKERGNWSGRFDFLLSMLGYAVGLGNIWRFPYLAYRNGGGAFLFPFLLMMAIVGIPLFFMESSLGQFCSRGAMTCWKFSPLFKGIGIAMVIVSSITAIYYNMILAWSLYYLFASFTSELPWTSCDNHWNTQDCSLKLPLITCSEGVKELNGTCYSTDDKFLGLWNATLFTAVTKRKRRLPSDEYWNGYALNVSPGIEDFGTPQWKLVLCLMLAWVICFFCLIKGIKSTGKVVYFTAIFPYVVLLILFIRGATLDGAVDGMKYFIIPDFARLGDARVWKDAANQIFFSMSIAGGGLITLSSYNRFNNNILKDSLIVCFGDSLTCIFAGFVIFSYLGHMAKKLGVHVKDVATDGAGLAFVVYPEAVSSLPPSTLWAILFFFMLLTLGLDSQFAMMETVLTAFTDQFPHLRKKKTWVILALSFLFFLLGLPLTCQGGIYLLQLMDTYGGGWTLIIIGFFEVVAIAFIYGAERFFNDIRIMTGQRPSIYWKICWYGLSPVTIVFIFIFTWVDYERMTYGDYLYPEWADAMGWIMSLSSVLAIPITMIYKINRDDEGSTIAHKIRLLTMPARDWGPALPQHRKLVKEYVDDFVIDPQETLPPKSYYNLGFSSTTTLGSMKYGSSQISVNSAAQSDYTAGGSISTKVSRGTEYSFESVV